MSLAKCLGLPLLAVALCSISVGQGHGGTGRGTIAAGHRSVTGFGSRLQHRGLRHSPYLYGAPYFYSDYDFYEPDYEPPPPAPPAAPVAPVKSEPVPDAVMLELRGNQWVRITNFGEASTQAAAAEPAAQTAPRKEMLPAVLVYRDGHTEEVSSYSIIGQVMYTKSDYWSSGAWTRTIQIADLDVPATLKQNQERGVKFELPSGPDEVILRP